MMNKISFLILLLSIVTSTSCRTTRTATGRNQITPNNQETSNPENKSSVNFSEQSTWLLGYFNPGRLKSEPYSEWFYKGYDEYHTDPSAIKSLTESGVGDLSIRIVMGTWCPDSRREVPRFMKVLDAWKFPADRITFIGVDNGKLSPVGGYDALDIQRVPTFIIYKNNLEAGRIIENPTTSLEQDMVNILRGMNNNK